MNKTLVPSKKRRLKTFKNEIASELGVSLKDSKPREYSGNLTAMQNGMLGGPVGGEMVRRMVEQYKNSTK
jgi:small acid-soluble spore protein D (minor alpha/beta-type SASP)